jgi:hypothetical protein
MKWEFHLFKVSVDFHADVLKTYVVPTAIVAAIYAT